MWSEGLLFVEVFFYVINNDLVYSDVVFGYDIRDSCLSFEVFVKEVLDILRYENDGILFENCLLKNVCK